MSLEVLITAINSAHIRQGAQESNLRVSKVLQEMGISSSKLTNKTIEANLLEVLICSGTFASCQCGVRT